MILDALVSAALDPAPIPEPTVAAAGVVPGEREPRPSRAQVARTTAAIPPAGWVDFAACVEDRESHGIPTVVNGSGHAGLFQFSRNWAHGLPYVVQRALVAAGMPVKEARAIRKTLAAKPIHRWPAIYQRIGFAQVIREGGRAAAFRHWGLNGSRCNGLAG